MSPVLYFAEWEGCQPQCLWLQAWVNRASLTVNFCLTWQSPVQFMSLPSSWWSVKVCQATHDSILLLKVRHRPQRKMSLQPCAQTELWKPRGSIKKMAESSAPGRHSHTVIFKPSCEIFANILNIGESGWISGVVSSYLCLFFFPPIDVKLRQPPVNKNEDGWRRCGVVGVFPVGSSNLWQ